LFGLARSTHYYKPVPVRDSTLAIMARIVCYTRRIGLRTIYQKPRTKITGSPSNRFSWLVDIDKITSIDQVWATDITYIPMVKGFLYLVAFSDLFSRHSISWTLSNSLDTQFCMDALEMAFPHAPSAPGNSCCTLLQRI
jgi:putative transposase